ncbi:MAG: methionine synthase [Deltaproteobacteria bacterium]|nr:methionine synthase [Deltaproteobacteria bacterium]
MKNDIINNFHFKATGIGSVPSTDIKGTCLNILKQLPEIPFWPAFVKRSHLEKMSIQFSEGLPMLKIEEEKRSLAISSDEIESELVIFYEHFLSEDVDHFAISKEYAPGLYELIGLIRQDPEKCGNYIKGQTVGPVTFAAGILGKEGKSVLYNPDLLEAFTKGLAIKALWQVRELGKSGKKPIIFLDEPYLSGFGSAFSSIERHEVIRLIKDVIDYLREKSDALIGIHCCGNTDWSMIMETGPDIVNFDAFSYMDYFVLYPEDINRFIQGGGIIAWGIVPTHELTGDESLEGLYSKLEDSLNRFYELGLDPELLDSNSILTPACGMGTMEQASADRVLNLLSMLSNKMQ